MRYGVESRVKENEKEIRKVRKTKEKEIRKGLKVMDTQTKIVRKDQRKEAKEKDSKETRQDIKPILREAKLKAKPRARQFVTSVANLDILLETVGVQVINQDLSQQLFKNISIPGIKEMTLHGIKKMILLGMIPIGIKRLNGMIKDLLSRRLLHLLLLNQLVRFDGRINHKKFNGKFDFKKKFTVIQKKVKISRTRFTSVLSRSSLRWSSGTRL